MMKDPVVIIGAGPAGLAAAYELVVRGRAPLVLEKSHAVGGLARTEAYRGYLFDIGGHRFFTKIDLVDRLWRRLAGDDFIKVARTSRIYYGGRFYNYPLRFANALRNLGLLESFRVVLSYVQARLLPHGKEDTFAQWVTNRFGARLYETFFKTYTEKVWGIPCSSIRADWAAQRIKGLSLVVALANALFGSIKAKSLIEEFDYPLQGPGLMWQRFAEAVAAGGGQIRLGAELTQLHHSGGRVIAATWRENDRLHSRPVAQIISTMPLDRLVARLEPPPPAEVLLAAAGLSYRAFIIVMLIVSRRDLFPDQWIYIHDPAVRVGRMQNFKNWSPAMVPDPNSSSVGMEYFCTEGDELWTMSDGALIALARREWDALGMAPGAEVGDGIVVRQPDAYPVYDEGYERRVRTIADCLGGIENLQTAGRCGMHRYNNMDHSMYTGMLAAANLDGARHNLWEVNEEEEYLEQEKKQTLAQRALSRTFARMDPLALAAAVGAVAGLAVFLATVWLVVKGGEVVGPNLTLLAQYFAGYTVTLQGAFLAFAYSFFWGFLFGWLYAYLRNLLLAWYIYRARRQIELLTVRDFLDNF